MVTSIADLGVPIAHVLENILVFKPQLEAMMTTKGQILFREDWNYYTEVDGNEVGFYPFITGNNFPDFVKCREDSHFWLSKDFLTSIWHSLNFGYFPNPLLNVLVTDFLTFTLNEEQRWTEHHAKCPTHFLQNYVSLEKLIEDQLPHLASAYYLLANEINELQLDFSAEVQKNQDKFSTPKAPADIEKMYRARGVDKENRLIQDFWDQQEIQEVLNDIKIKLYKIIMSLIPTIRQASERSVLPSFGYDVFVANCISQDSLVIKNIGDYRILAWELKQE